MTSTPHPQGPAKRQPLPLPLRCVQTLLSSRPELRDGNIVFERRQKDAITHVNHYTPHVGLMSDSRDTGKKRRLSCVRVTVEICEEAAP